MKKRKKLRAVVRKERRQTGILHLHPDGYGFVEIEGREEDLFVPARAVGDALHLDEVEVEARRGRNDKMEGSVTEVLRRHTECLIGRLEDTGQGFRVIVADTRVRHQVLVPKKKVAGARNGENVVVRILRYPSHGEAMLGEVIEVLGERGEAPTEIKAAIIHHKLPQEFPQAALDDANSCRILERDYEGREDLRHLLFVTIDGETARDFDDAVTAERLENGNIRLWVSIADVAHFVKPNMPLDREALQRGTSVYFPQMCIPMLPEALSNNLCSLRPDEDRLTMTASLDINRQGEIIASSFCQSVIKSRRRMTYTEVKRLLVDKESEAAEELGPLVNPFHVMKECYERLRENRTRRGSIDFDLPEPSIVIDLQGGIESIVKARRYMSHMMIEEFMVAANEAVATFLTERRFGCIYRIHPPPAPEKLHEFSILLHNLGYKARISKTSSPGELAKVVKQVRGKPEERLVNHKLLRSMEKAIYSDENAGHYGLASTCYCHFTSPIRRYPDLVVHRLLKSALVRQSHSSSFIGKASIKGIANLTSKRERVALEAEREVAKLYAALFMQDRLGNEFDGVIAHVTKFGFFVELIDFFVEGLVHISTLKGRYRFDEHGMVLSAGKGAPEYKIGDRVRIRIKEVNIPAREISFELL